MVRRGFAAAVFVSTALFLGGTAASAEEENAALRAAIDSDFRTEAQKARDRYRHPYETLTFFDIQPDMTVAEIWPASGAWYMNILAPYLKENGKYIAVSFNTRGRNGCCGSGSFLPGNIATLQTMQNHADDYGPIDVAFTSRDDLDVLPEASVDRIVMFRSLHIWVNAGDAEVMLKPLWRALKPGGLFGFVQHRADPDFVDVEGSPGSTGYLTEDAVIKIFESVGFELVDKSEINANPNDDKQYDLGVWRLPPALANADEPSEAEIERRKAMGESDRMTLLFRRPAEAN